MDSTLPVSERLVFKPFEKSHSEHYMQWVTDPEIMRYISGIPLSPKNAEQRFIQALELGKTLPRGGYFMVRTRENNPVGFCKIQLFKPNVLEIGYIVATAHQQQGFASEMVGALIRHAHSYFVGHEIMALVDPENTGSIRVLTKNGFEFIKMIQKNGFLSGYFRYKCRNKPLQ